MSAFFDLDAERTVLAFLTSSMENCADAVSALRTELFEDYRHQRVWEAAKFYFQQYGGPLDRKGLETLFTQNEVPTDKQIIYLGLFDEIKGRVVTKDQFRVATETMETMRFKRGIYDLVNNLAADLQKGHIDRDKVCNDIVMSVVGLQGNGPAGIREISFKADAINRVEEYLDRQKNPEKYKGLPYGIKRIDDLTGGVLKGELSIIFGRPGAGKSGLLHNVAYFNALAAKHILYVSIEMPKEQIGRRLDSRHLQISARGLRAGRLRPEEESLFLEVSKKGITIPGDIYVIDMPQGCSVSQLLPVLRRHRLNHPVDALLIDYMNLMEPTKWSHSLVERTGTISRELKQLARLEQIPIITPARATRETTKTKDEDVGSEHLSWSDSLGYDADQIIYLRKDKAINPITAEIEALLVKFRDGSSERATIGANFDKSYMGDIENILKEVQVASGSAVFSV